MTTALTDARALPALRLDQPDPARSLPRWLENCVAALQADFTSPEIRAARAPTAEQRAMLQDRLAEVQRLLVPATMDEAAGAFTGCLVSFPQQAVDATTASARVRSYFTALDGVPAWAISSACDQWLRGDVPGLTLAQLAFAPSPPQLRRLADERVAGLRSHGFTIRRLLTAKVVPDPPATDIEGEH